MSHTRLSPLAPALALALLATTAVVSAFWTGSGQASNSASLATLSAPTISSATPGAQTVELTWSAVTPPAGGTVEYFLTRDGGAPGGGCPSSGSPSTATSCTDTGMSVGTHEYTVTAVWRTWTATSTIKSVTVAFGPATHLVLEAASTTPTAGASDNLTITAKDASGDTVRTYTGAHSLIFEGAEESPNATKPVVIDRSNVTRSFGEATEITFTEGKATVASSKNGVMKLYNAETAEVVVSEGSLSNGAGLAVTVKVAATKKFSVPTPSEQEAGVAFNVTLTATDEWGNLAKSYTGAKTIAWSGPSSSPNATAAEYPSTATTVTFTEGVGTASALKLSDAQSTTLKAKEGTTVEGVTGSFTVKAATPERFAWARAEVTAGALEAGTCPFACKTTSIGASKKFKAHASVTDAYGNIVSNIGATDKAKVEQTSGAGTLTNATSLTIPASGLAESSGVFEYTSPTSGTSEAVLKLKAEEGTTYTEAEAHVKY
jgi:hypothetical protein